MILFVQSKVKYFLIGYVDILKNLFEDTVSCDYFHLFIGLSGVNYTPPSYSTQV